jgi:2-polyprenyl-6-hydroxyphenyl methylase / 3-demethylubiquinone-9 3-methyltransferase
MDPKRPARTVNNEIYDALGDRWYDAEDDPVALLRAESSCRAPWVTEEMARAFGGRPARVLDVGCGAGFLANALARQGHRVTGIDTSQASLAAAARHDDTGDVRYAIGDARRLSFDDGAFDVVCAMDLLEHIEEPALVVAEASRVLAPGGLFFFHTFNRNWLSWLVVIKGVEWFVKNTPRDLHVLHLFLKPDEIRGMCAASEMSVRMMRGLEPVTLSKAFLRLLATGTVPLDFQFRFTNSTRMGYTGLAAKRGEWAPRAAPPGLSGERAGESASA